MITTTDFQLTIRIIILEIWKKMRTLTFKQSSTEFQEWKNWCLWTVLLENTLESPLDHKEIKPVNPKGNQSCIFIGRTDAEAEAPILQTPDMKSQLIRKDLLLGKIESRRRRGWQRKRWLMASPTQWAWFWASSERWWRTGKPGLLQSLGSQRVWHNWGT